MAKPDCISPDMSAERFIERTARWVAPENVFKEDCCCSRDGEESVRPLRGVWARLYELIEQFDFFFFKSFDLLGQPATV
jgi:hypothetical protein